MKEFQIKIRFDGKTYTFFSTNDCISIPLNNNSFIKIFKSEHIPEKYIMYWKGVVLPLKTFSPRGVISDKLTIIANVDELLHELESYGIKIAVEPDNVVCCETMITLSLFHLSQAAKAYLVHNKTKLMVDAVNRFGAEEFLVHINSIKDINGLPASLRECIALAKENHASVIQFTNAIGTVSQLPEYEE